MVDPAILSIQTWAGIVKKVNKNYFTARLIDRTNVDNADKIAEIDFTEVQTSERELIIPDTLFYWHLFTFKNPRGNERNQSTIRFKRVLPITEAEMSGIKKRSAERVAKFIEI